MSAVTQQTVLSCPTQKAVNKHIRTFERVKCLTSKGNTYTLTPYAANLKAIWRLIRAAKSRGAIVSKVFIPKIAMAPFNLALHNSVCNLRCESTGGKQRIQDAFDFIASLDEVCHFEDRYTFLANYHSIGRKIIWTEPARAPCEEKIRGDKIRGHKYTVNKKPAKASTPSRASDFCVGDYDEPDYPDCIWNNNPDDDSRCVDDDYDPMWIVSDLPWTKPLILGDYLDVCPCQCGRVRGQQAMREQWHGGKNWSHSKNELYRVVAGLDSTMDIATNVSLTLVNQSKIARRRYDFWQSFHSKYCIADECGLAEARCWGGVSPIPVFDDASDTNVSFDDYRPSNYRPSNPQPLDSSDTSLDRDSPFQGRDNSSNDSYNSLEFHSIMSCE
jgi:hypothetical protein